MCPLHRSKCHPTQFRRMLLAALVLVAAGTAFLAGSLPGEKVSASHQPEKVEKKSEPAPQPAPEKAPSATEATGKRSSDVVEILCTDGTTLRLKVLDQRIELNTSYGKLQIPVRDIERIEVAFRLSEDTAKRIDAAIADLGSSEFERREAASAALLELQDRAYPALLKAAKSRDAETARRARELLDKIRDEVPEERLQFRPHDVVYTAESKNTGRITAATLKVLTAQFGEQQLKLSSVLEVRSPSAAPVEVADAVPDPGTLSGLAGQIGKVYTFRVNAVVAGAGFVWGSGPYTLDSNLALAAVHAGVLKQGQVGVVRVKILGMQAAFAGSTRNGVTTQPYAAFNAFEFVRGRGQANR